MKLTWENNKGDKVIVIYNKDCITDNEVALDANMALEPMWESLKAKIVEEYEARELSFSKPSKLKDLIHGLKNA